MAGRRVRVVTRRAQALGAAALVLLASACGARVDDHLRQAAAAAALTAGGGGTDSGGYTGDNSTSAAGPGTTTVGGSKGTTRTGTVRSGGSRSGTTTTTRGSQGSGPTTSGSGGQNGGAPAPAGGNGGATDVGVTADSITVGNVADLSGPVDGLFEGAPNGVNAYFAYVNSQGGVYGRQLKLRSADDQTDCGTNKSVTTDLIPQVFTFVGSFSLYDDCNAQVLNQHPDLPVVQTALSTAAKAAPTVFTPQVQQNGYPTGMFAYWKQKYGDKVTKVGTIYPNIASAAFSWREFQNSAQSQGWRIIYQRAVGATETDFTSDVVRMKNAGVQIVWLPAVNMADSAAVKQEADSQNWHPLFIMPIAYDSTFIQAVGGPDAAEGILGAQIFSLFFSANDAKSIPEVALYQQWMNQANPGATLDLFSMYGWASGKLFVDALKAAGPKATRAGLMAALKNIHKFDDNGMLATSDPGAKGSAHCYVLWQIHNGQFQRVDTPASGYRCDGQFLPYHGG